MKILVPIDGSEYSLQGLKIASDYAKFKEADIFLISVVPVTADLDLEISPHNRESLINDLKTSYQNKLDKAKEMLEADGINAQMVLSSGHYSISEEIIKFVEDKEIDLVIIGSRGLSGTKKWFLGSIATKVARDCPCSVYVVKKLP